MEKAFLEFVARIMEVNPDELGMNTKYKEFDKWDSLMMLTLVMELEVEYGVSIPIEKITYISNLGDLFVLVKNK